MSTPIYFEDKNEIRRKLLNREYRCGVIGLGFVGLPLLVLLGEKGLSAVGYDNNNEKVESIKSGKSPIYEVGLQEMLSKSVVEARIAVSSDPGILSTMDILIVTTGTPWNEDTKSADLSQIVMASETIACSMKKGSVMVVKSTVPVGTTEKTILPILEEKSGMKGGIDFGLAFCPERVVEGRVLEEFQTLPKVIGAIDDRSYRVAECLLEIIGGKIVRVSSPSIAELVKLTDNYSRDVSIAIVNQLALICENLGLDVIEVIDAAKEGYDRNKGLMIPGAGVGGSCLNKDPYILASISEKAGQSVNLVYAARSINNEMPKRIVHLAQKVTNRLGKRLEDCRITIAGIAFKRGTSDIRYSPAVTVIKELDNLRSEIVCHDPLVLMNEFKVQFPNVKLVRDLDEACKNSDLLIVLTDHDDYERLDLGKLKCLMNSRAGIVDGRHLIDPREAMRKGFEFEGVGRPSGYFRGRS
jgi:UDP-N-acetyl-D-mannosaminuronic acid dehydrogenase